MRKYLRITELIWASLAFLCLSVTIYLFWIGDKEDGGFAMLVTSLATVMYLMRMRFNRILRRAEEKQKKESEGKL
ncbi:MAG TPA: hypothetical protein VL651_16555 [Bacteroidia bacterium]|jgi:hypothetical protein|nr:hypothetical protein [Bacteroidia bacterium]